jgi:hypothetical protein
MGLLIVLAEETKQARNGFRFISARRQLHQQYGKD